MVLGIVFQFEFLSNMLDKILLRAVPVNGCTTNLCHESMVMLVLSKSPRFHSPAAMFFALLKPHIILLLIPLYMLKSLFCKEIRYVSEDEQFFFVSYDALYKHMD